MEMENKKATGEWRWRRRRSTRGTEAGNKKPRRRNENWRSGQGVESGECDALIEAWRDSVGSVTTAPSDDYPTLLPSPLYDLPKHSHRSHHLRAFLLPTDLDGSPSNYPSSKGQRLYEPSPGLLSSEWEVSVVVLSMKCLFCPESLVINVSAPKVTTVSIPGSPPIVVISDLNPSGQDIGPMACQDSNPSNRSPTALATDLGQDSDLPIDEDDDMDIFLNLEGSEDHQHCSDSSKKRRLEEDEEHSSSYTYLVNATTIPILGRPYTWKSRAWGHLIYEKLDRDIGQSDWNTNYPNAIIAHGPFTYSDHCFLLLITQAISTRQKQPPF
ncbi:hypothetical protein Cgig2_004336 [Carnegiea gigantea]|uniref:Uncharacterized protein n=1 Tax=Carnegiea gigantea TaxID=171969 RepID=A0A9Q1JY27_9CARY|nr:hypothetical protein Cgig2_004336 [Carnegiea gigantea]